MKVLIDRHEPFLLVHGGLQIQIEQTASALKELGVEVEWLRWWDRSQTGTVIHFFGRPPAGMIRMAHAKGLRLVFNELLTAPGSRSPLRLAVQHQLSAAARRFLPAAVSDQTGWSSYRLADAVLAVTPWEAELMAKLYGGPRDKIHVVPNGVEAVFFATAAGDPASDPHSVCGELRSGPLLCTATITERKRVVELAQAATLAGTPLQIIGDPYSSSDPYFQKFLDVVKHSRGMVLYEGGIEDRARLAQLYRNSAGFVLLSSMESLSLSALEAAAAGVPLLLSDLPWARSSFGAQASYCPLSGTQQTAQQLSAFQQAAPNLTPPLRPYTWREIASQLAGIYRGLH